MTAELDRLQIDLVKAKKSLDHATPGVLNATYFTCSFVHITDCYRNFSFLGFAFLFLHAIYWHLKYAPINYC